MDQYKYILLFVLVQVTEESYSAQKANLRKKSTVSSDKTDFKTCVCIKQNGCSSFYPLHHQFWKRTQKEQELTGHLMIYLKVLCNRVFCT